MEKCFDGLFELLIVSVLNDEKDYGDETEHLKA